jgi:hypothetical protein
MKEHIEKTIADLREKIGALQRSVDLLRVIGEEPTEDTVYLTDQNGQAAARIILGKNDNAPAKPEPAPAADFTKPKRRKFQRATRPDKPLSRAEALQQGKHTLEVLATFKEPFTQEDFASAAGITRKQGYGFFTRWKKAGLVVRVGRNQYRRADSAPSAPALSPEKRSHIPIPGLDPESDQDKLEKAISDRNKARAANQTTLAQILENKVQMLVERIASA